MSEMKSSRQKHVAVLAFPFASHPLPLFNLMSKLASSNCRTRSALPNNVKLYSVDDGIPECHVGVENGQEEAGLFIKAVPRNFKDGIDVAATETGKKLTCLVTDAFLSFSVGKMAEEMSVPWVSFWVPAPYAFQLIFTWIKDQSLESIPGLSALCIGDLPKKALPRDQSQLDFSPFSAMIRSMGVLLHKASAVVMISFQEINPVLLINDMRLKFQNFLYVGFLSLPVPLPPPTVEDKTGCLSWLANKKASVAYISFGTLAAIPGNELEALAEALHVINTSSGVPFLWSLKDNFKSYLPDGFLERTRNQGKVVPWAPQGQVLAHGSIGVHVAHGGHNSVCESILGGVPMICRPVCADHYMNARMVEQGWGIGVRVEAGLITRSGMLKSLATVFHHENGQKMRDAIGGLKEAVLKAAGLSGSAAKDFNTLLRLIA
ncbi:hypothetical protein K2173_003686 [Erythroxylum novogranatense]|uniref:Glycosyltransferase n=1 Tax=Erythroxylum novogranatense TaxID=1862640 RepID=A0AAV8TD12_9ROSI|nr:hypothetical protein K2173_003686 [Erythroxylum novogranatense]